MNKNKHTNVNINKFIHRPIDVSNITGCKFLFHSNNHTWDEPSILGDIHDYMRWGYKYEEYVADVRNWRTAHSQSREQFTKLPVINPLTFSTFLQK
jgi:hypothetical protein